MKKQVLLSVSLLTFQFCIGQPNSEKEKKWNVAESHGPATTVEFTTNEADSSIMCNAQVETYGKTGVEMEALTAVQIGLLTIYDMCKAIDRGMTITDVRVMEKLGGKSGHWKTEE